jgi:hypothetical protein
VKPCIWLSILGGVLEITGFLLVAVELFRTQRREFGTPTPIRLFRQARDRVRIRIRRLLGRTKTHLGSGTLTAKVNLTASAKAQLRRGWGKTLEDHVSALEKNLAELDREVEEHRAELDQAIKGVSDDLKAMRVDLEQQWKEREDDQREFLRTSVTLQWWGIGLFVLGTAISAVANVISCS